MGTRAPFGVGEWYHCYNRGVDKRRVFQNTKDYDRFTALLYLANGTKRLHLSDYKNRTLTDIVQLSIDRGAPLVEIGAWCLMPNHVHLLLREVEENGIAQFMQKVFTGYTMYFNKKNDRVGSLFAGSFKSKHVADDRYLKQLVSYIHMNPVELQYPEWESGSVSVKEASAVLDRYAYSSLYAFEYDKCVDRRLLGDSIFKMFDVMPKIGAILKNAREYFIEHNVKV